VSFRYYRDPLFLASCTLYCGWRWLFKPHVHSIFLHSYASDVLLIPAALPLLLWVHRQLGWRNDDRSPTWAEIGLHWVVFSAVCEGLAPLIIRRATADWGDVLAYGIGAIVAGWIWGSALI
jgi:hypothetical protein